MSWNSFLSCLQRVNDISHDLVHSIRNSHNNPDSLAAQLGLITASKNFIPVSNNLLSFHHDFMWLENYTARKLSVFGVILFRIFPHSDWIRRETSVSLTIQSKCGKMQTRITRNTDTFYAVLLWLVSFSIL